MKKCFKHQNVVTICWLVSVTFNILSSVKRTMEFWPYIWRRSGIEEQVYGRIELQYITKNMGNWIMKGTGNMEICQYKLRKGGFYIIFPTNWEWENSKVTINSIFTIFKDMEYFKKGIFKYTGEFRDILALAKFSRQRHGSSSSNVLQWQFYWYLIN